MTWLDWTVVVVIALSLVLGLFRGFVREVVALAGWVIAGWVAATFAQTLAAALPAAISEPTVRWGAAFFVIFLAVLIVASIASLFMRGLMRAVGLGLADRFLGAAFGALRGAAILVIAVLLAGLTPLREDPSWKQSRFMPALEAAANWIRPHIPDAVRTRMVVNAVRPTKGA